MKLYTSPPRGVALIIALLVVALATVLIAGLLDRGELAMARTRNQSRETQAQSYALGLEAYAAKVLMQDPNTIDSADSPWAVPLPPTPVPGGTIAATMSDLGGRFNLNNLDPKYDTPQQAWQHKFERLLDVLKLDRKLAKDVAAWMDATTPSATVASDGFYLGQPVPYRAAGRPFVHVSELRLIRGVNGDVYAALAPYVAALPAGTKINVNTASVPVLMTLDDTVTAEIAQAIWQQGHARYQQLQEIGKEQPQLVQVLRNPQVALLYDVHSAYFLARGEITLDSVPFEYASLIERRIGGNAGAGGGVRVLQRSRGSD